MWVTDQNGESVWQDDDPNAGYPPAPAVSGPSGSTGNPIYRPDGSIDWGQTSTGYDATGNPSTQPGIPSAQNNYSQYWYPGPQSGAPTAPGATQGSAENSWWWDPTRGNGGQWVQVTGGSASGGGGSSSAGQAGKFYEGLSPFSYPEFAPQEFNAPTFDAPAPFSYPEFAAPSGQQVLNDDPGYGFRRDEGLRTIRNEKSAQGILKTGGTLKSLADWAEGLASQEYGQAYDRSLGSWQANRGAKADDYDRLWKNTLSDYMLKYNAEGDKFNRSLATYGANNKNAVTKYGFDLDLAGGKAGQQNTGFNQLLSLYDISTRDLPKYTPVTYQPSLN